MPCSVPDCLVLTRTLCSSASCESLKSGQDLRMRATAAAHTAASSRPTADANASALPRRFLVLVAAVPLLTALLMVCAWLPALTALRLRAAAAAAAWPAESPPTAAAAPCLLLPAGTGVAWSSGVVAGCSHVYRE